MESPAVFEATVGCLFNKDRMVADKKLNDPDRTGILAESVKRGGCQYCGNFRVPQVIEIASSFRCIDSEKRVGLP